MLPGSLIEEDECGNGEELGPRCCLRSQARYDWRRGVGLGWVDLTSKRAPEIKGPKCFEKSWTADPERRPARTD